MLDAVLLEWEGVLADTGAARRDALLRALADEGAPSTVAAYDACCAGLDVRSAAVAALRAAGRDDATLAEIVALRAARAFTERLAEGFSLMPGAVDLVTGAAHRTRVAIVTQAGRAETEVAVRLAGLEGAFSAVLSADDVTDPPPSPALVERALAHLARLRPTRAGHVVAVVQALPAIRAARSAGVRTLAVGVRAHVAAEADGVVDDLREVTLDTVVRLTGGAPAATRA
jgi:beta-phosphoglucomutase-like phosphatase (HAD superfamily)